MAETRIERDLLGEREIPAAALYGIATRRAVENFPLSGRPVHRGLVRGFGAVKLACANQCRARIPDRSDGGASRGGLPGDDAWRRSMST